MQPEAGMRVSGTAIQIPENNGRKSHAAAAARTFPPQLLTASRAQNIIKQ
jgi:hypothetical protein